jgi:hypothetical protein
MMKKSIVYLAAVFFISINSHCSKDKDTFHKAGAWDLSQFGTVVEYYYLTGEMEEAELKERLVARANQLKNEYDFIEIYAFYDEKLARRVGSKESKKVFMAMGMQIGRNLFADPGLAVKGGAMLRVPPDKPEGEWFFLEKGRDYDGGAGY